MELLEKFGESGREKALKHKHFGGIVRDWVGEGQKVVHAFFRPTVSWGSGCTHEQNPTKTPGQFGEEVFLSPKT